MGDIVLGIALILGIGVIGGFGGGLGFAYLLARKLDSEITRRLDEVEERFPPPDTKEEG